LQPLTFVPDKRNAPEQESSSTITSVPTMSQLLKIDFVSDISCPWCAIGLSSLAQALSNLHGEIDADMHIQPFELNPQMPAGGQDIGEHLAQKYGSTPEQQAQIRDTIRQRGADAGFSFNASGRGRIYNTLDAHRLLHWAGLASADRQLALKKALMVACHGESQAMESPEVLLAAVAQVGLDVARAQAILASDEFAAEVREAEAFYNRQGIHSVPAVIVNDRHLISGGQTAAVYEQALRQIAAQPPAA
jgi:predicted DsbA family dithiol-disulfide isomerase